jgi:hypothetical protein
MPHLLHLNRRIEPNVFQVRIRKYIVALTRESLGHWTLLRVVTQFAGACGP